MEWWDNLLQDQLSVLLFPYPFHPPVTTVARKTTPVVLPKVHAGGRWQLNNVVCTPYVRGFARNDMVVWCTLNTLRQQ